MDYNSTRKRLNIIRAKISLREYKTFLTLLDKI